MARPGIEYKSVERVARQLLSKGQHPSVQKVRDILGTGSNTTIAKHLKSWQEAFSQSQSPTLPKSVPDDLMVPLDDFWNTAVTRAEANYQKLKEELENKVTTAELNLAKIESQLEEKSNENDVLHENLLDTKKALYDTEQQLNNLQGKHSVLSDELNHTHNEIDKTHILLKDQNLNIKNEREIINSTHEKSLQYERERNNETENRLLNEIDQLRQAVKSMKEIGKSQQKEFQLLNENKHQHELVLVQEITDLKSHNNQLISDQQQHFQYREELKQQLGIHQKQAPKFLETIDSMRQSLEDSKNNEIELVGSIGQLKEIIAQLQQKRGNGDEHTNQD